MSSPALDIPGLGSLKRKFKELSDSEITSVLKECNYDVCEAAPKLQKVEYERLKKIAEDTGNKCEYGTFLSEIRSPRILIPPVQQKEKELQAKESSDEDMSINDLGEGEEKTIEGKDAINEKSNTNDILCKKLKFLESDMPGLRKTDLEWEKLCILYEVDAARYGFIFADFMFESAMMLNSFVSGLFKDGDWILEFDRVISLYTKGCIRDIAEFGTMYKLASDILHGNIKNLKVVKSLMVPWLEKDFKELKTKVLGYCTTTTITGEKPGMRYFSTQKELLEERKATLLHLHKEFASECGFIIDKYVIGVLGSLQKKFRKLSNAKKIWTLDEVRVVYDGAKEAKTLLLFEDVDEDVSKFANLGDIIEELEGKGSFEVRVMVERIRVWVGNWAHKSSYEPVLCLYL